MRCALCLTKSNEKAIEETLKEMGIEEMEDKLREAISLEGMHL